MLFYLKITILVPPLSALKLSPKVKHNADHKASSTFSPKVFPKASLKVYSKVPTKDAPKGSFNFSPKVSPIVAP